MSSLCPLLPGPGVAGVLTTCEGREGGAGKGLGKAEPAAPDGSCVLSTAAPPQIRSNLSTPQKRNPATGKVFSFRGLGTAAEVWPVPGVLWLEIRDKAAPQVCTTRENKPPLQHPGRTTARALVWKGTGGGEKGHNLFLSQKKQTQHFVFLHLSV